MSSSAYARSACHGGRTLSEQEGTTLDRYEVELEPAEPDGFAAVVPALPGLLVFGRDVDEVLERVRAAIAFHLGRGPLPVRLAVGRQDRGEVLAGLPSLSGDGPGRRWFPLNDPSTPYAMGRAVSQSSAAARSSVRLIGSVAPAIGCGGSRLSLAASSNARAASDAADHGRSRPRNCPRRAPPAGPAIVSAGCRSCCRARCSAWWAHAATTRATSCCPTASWPRSSPRVLNTPVHCCFDEQGSCCVVECGHKIEARPRILRVDVSTDTCQTFFEWPAERWSKTGAVTGACWHQGALYVANTDTLSRIGPDGRLEDLVTGLPGKGDHQTNHPVVGPDGKLYWGRGSATNTGVVGADNFPCEWLPIYADARRTIRQAWLARSSLRPGYSQAWVPPRRSSKKYWSGKGESV